jgi:DNA polymerase
VESPVLFVEEAPSPGQDADGHIAAGDAAELFEKILKAMGLTREQVFVVHAVRCLPPRLAGDERHRKPLSEEVDACRAHLRELVRLIRPRVIVALGSSAARGILRTQEPVARLRSQWREWGGIPVMATFHPSYLIENKDLAIKRKVWEDLLQVMERLEMPISAKQRGFFLK